MVTVADDGRGPAPGRRPRATAWSGMRERVAVHGGRLRTGPRPGGGFLLRGRGTRCQREEAPMIRVFLVDDQAMVRAGFTMLVDSQDDMTVVGEAGDGGEAVRAARA